MSEESLICSFCSKSRKDVTKMIVGAKKTTICDECVKLCVEILDEDRLLEIHLPKGYKESGQIYPVLYLLDSYYNFSHN